MSYDPERTANERRLALSVQTLNQVRNLTHHYLSINLTREEAFLQIQRVMVDFEKRSQALEQEISAQIRRKAETQQVVE